MTITASIDRKYYIAQPKPPRRIEGYNMPGTYVRTYVRTYVVFPNCHVGAVVVPHARGMAIRTFVLLLHDLLPCRLIRKTTLTSYTSSSLGHYRALFHVIIIVVRLHSLALDANYQQQQQLLLRQAPQEEPINGPTHVIMPLGFKYVTVQIINDHACVCVFSLGSHKERVNFDVFLNLLLLPFLGRAHS